MVTLIRILNQRVKYSTHLMGKRVNRIMVTFVHMLSYLHRIICSECWHRLGQNYIPSWGCMVRPGLPIANPDAKSGKYTFTALSANVERLICKFDIIDIGIPYGCSRRSIGIMKLVEKDLKLVALVGLGVTA